jgi:hypothetical protein
METFATGEAVIPKNCQNETWGSYSPHLRQVVKQRPSFLANLLAQAGHGLAGLEQLLGHLERGEDRHRLRVRTACALLHVPELRVDVGRQGTNESVFVVGLERVSLAGDLDRDRALHPGQCIMRVLGSASARRRVRRRAIARTSPLFTVPFCVKKRYETASSGL